MGVSPMGLVFGMVAAFIAGNATMLAAVAVAVTFFSGKRDS